MKTTVRQAGPLQSVEVHSGADIHLQPMEGTPHWSRWMPEGDCDPMGSLRWSKLLPGPAERGAHAGAGLLAGLVTPCAPHRSSLFLKDCTPWKGPTLGHIMKSCSPSEGPMQGQFVKSCNPWEEFILEKFVENYLP